MTYGRVARVETGVSPLPAARRGGLRSPGSWMRRHRPFLRPVGGLVGGFARVEIGRLKEKKLVFLTFLDACTEK